MAAQLSAADEGDARLRPHSWALMALLLFAAVAVLPDLFDAEVVKRAATAMLAAAVILPLLALTGREALLDWFTSAGARLVLAVTGLSLIASLGHADEAAVTDRLLTFGLVNTAAVLGVLAAQRDPQALGRALRWSALPVALVAWSQALGWERTLTPGPEEVVALSGNSTLAGALLAVGTLAWVTHLACGTRALRGRLELPPMLALALVSGALVLTRARGARVAVAVALAVLLISGGLAAARARRKHCDGPPSEPRVILRPAVIALLAGITLAGLVGGGDALMAHKLQDDGAILQGGDLTTNVRLALARSTGDMVLDSPWSGVGLGRFRAEFPPYRDALEASLPGLAGAQTEARHPHNEFLLVAAEGGLPAAALLLLFVALTLARARRYAIRGEAPDVLAALVLLAGTLLALVQDAWTDPATALPVFAAAGFVWATKSNESLPAARQPLGQTPLAKAITIATLLLGLGLALLAWPRLDSHLSLRSFYLRAQEAGGLIGPASFSALMHAAEAGPGDVDVQRMMELYGIQYAPQAPDIETRVAAIQAVDAARERLAVLAPHAR